MNLGEEKSAFKRKLAAALSEFSDYVAIRTPDFLGGPVGKPLGHNTRLFVLNYLVGGLAGKWEP